MKLLRRGASVPSVLYAILLISGYVHGDSIWGAPCVWEPCTALANPVDIKHMKPEELKEYETVLDNVKLLHVACFDEEVYEIIHNIKTNDERDFFVAFYVYKDHDFHYVGSFNANRNIFKAEILNHNHYFVRNFYHVYVGNGRSWVIDKLIMIPHVKTDIIEFCDDIHCKFEIDDIDENATELVANVGESAIGVDKKSLESNALPECYPLVRNIEANLEANKNVYDKQNQISSNKNQLFNYPLISENANNCANEPVCPYVNTFIKPCTYPQLKNYPSTDFQKISPYYIRLSNLLGVKPGKFISNLCPFSWKGPVSNTGTVISVPYSVAKQVCPVKTSPKIYPMTQYDKWYSPYLYYATHNIKPNNIPGDFYKRGYSCLSNPDNANGFYSNSALNINQMQDNDKKYPKDMISFRLASTNNENEEVALANAKYSFENPVKYLNGDDYRNGNLLPYKASTNAQATATYIGDSCLKDDEHKFVLYNGEANSFNKNTGITFRELVDAKYSFENPVKDLNGDDYRNDNLLPYKASTNGQATATYIGDSCLKDDEHKFILHNGEANSFNKNTGVTFRGESPYISNQNQSPIKMMQTNAAHGVNYPYYATNQYKTAPNKIKSINNVKLDDQFKEVSATNAPANVLKGSTETLIVPSSNQGVYPYANTFVKPFKYEQMENSPSTRTDFQRTCPFYNRLSNLLGEKPSKLISNLRPFSCKGPVFNSGSVIPKLNSIAKQVSPIKSLQKTYPMTQDDKWYSPYLYYSTHNTKSNNIPEYFNEREYKCLPDSDNANAAININQIVEINKKETSDMIANDQTPSTNNNNDEVAPENVKYSIENPMIELNQNDDSDNLLPNGTPTNGQATATCSGDSYLKDDEHKFVFHNGEANSLNKNTGVTFRGEPPYIYNQNPFTIGIDHATLKSQPEINNTFDNKSQFNDNQAFEVNEKQFPITVNLLPNGTPTNGQATATCSGDSYLKDDEHKFAFYSGEANSINKNTGAYRGAPPYICKQNPFTIGIDHDTETIQPEKNNIILENKSPFNGNQAYQVNEKQSPITTMQTNTAHGIYYPYDAINQYKTAPNKIAFNDNMQLDDQFKEVRKPMGIEPTAQNYEIRQNQDKPYYVETAPFFSNDMILNSNSNGDTTYLQNPYGTTYLQKPCKDKYSVSNMFVPGSDFPNLGAVNNIDRMLIKAQQPEYNEEISGDATSSFNGDNLIIDVTKAFPNIISSSYNNKIQYYNKGMPNYVSVSHQEPQISEGLQQTFKDGNYEVSSTDTPVNLLSGPTETLTVPNNDYGSFNSDVFVAQGYPTVKSDTILNYKPENNNQNIPVLYKQNSNKMVNPKIKNQQFYLFDKAAPYTLPDGSNDINPMKNYQMQYNEPKNPEIQVKQLNNEVNNNNLPVKASVMFNILPEYGISKNQIIKPSDQPGVENKDTNGSDTINYVYNTENKDAGVSESETIGMFANPSHYIPIMANQINTQLPINVTPEKVTVPSYTNADDGSLLNEEQTNDVTAIPIQNMFEKLSDRENFIPKEFSYDTENRQPLDIQQMKGIREEKQYNIESNTDNINEAYDDRSENAKYLPVQYTVANYDEGDDQVKYDVRPFDFNTKRLQYPEFIKNEEDPQLQGIELRPNYIINPNSANHITPTIDAISLEEKSPPDFTSKINYYDPYTKAVNENVYNDRSKTSIYMNTDYIPRSESIFYQFNKETQSPFNIDEGNNGGTLNAQKIEAVDVAVEQYPRTVCQYSDVIKTQPTIQKVVDKIPFGLTTNVRESAPIFHEDTGTMTHECDKKVMAKNPNIELPSIITKGDSFNILTKDTQETNIPEKEIQGKPVNTSFQPERTISNISPSNSPIKYTLNTLPTLNLDTKVIGKPNELTTKPSASISLQSDSVEIIPNIRNDTKYSAPCSLGFDKPVNPVESITYGAKEQIFDNYSDTTDCIKYGSDVISEDEKKSRVVDIEVAPAYTDNSNSRPSYYQPSNANYFTPTILPKYSIQQRLESWDKPKNNINSNTQTMQQDVTSEILSNAETDAGSIVDEQTALNINNTPMINTFKVPLVGNTASAFGSESEAFDFNTVPNDEKSVGNIAKTYHYNCEPVIKDYDQINKYAPINPIQYFMPNTLNEGSSFDSNFDSNKIESNNPFTEETSIKQVGYNTNPITSQLLVPKYELDQPSTPEMTTEPSSGKAVIINNPNTAPNQKLYVSNGGIIPFNNYQIDEIGAPDKLNYDSYYIPNTVTNYRANEELPLTEADNKVPETNRDSEISHEQVSKVSNVLNSLTSNQLKDIYLPTWDQAITDIAGKKIKDINIVTSQGQDQNELHNPFTPNVLNENPTRGTSETVSMESPNRIMIGQKPCIYPVSNRLLIERENEIMKPYEDTENKGANNMAVTPNYLVETTGSYKPQTFYDTSKRYPTETLVNDKVSFMEPGVSIQPNIQLYPQHKTYNNYMRPWNWNSLEFPEQYNEDTKADMFQGTRDINEESNIPQKPRPYFKSMNSVNPIEVCSEITPEPTSIVKNPKTDKFTNINLNPSYSMYNYPPNQFESITNPKQREFPAFTANADVGTSSSYVTIPLPTSSITPSNSNYYPFTKNSISDSTKTSETLITADDSNSSKIPSVLNLSPQSQYQCIPGVPQKQSFKMQPNLSIQPNIQSSPQHKTYNKYMTPALGIKKFPGIYNTGNSADIFQGTIDNDEQLNIDQKASSHINTISKNPIQICSETKTEPTDTLFGTSMPSINTLNPYLSSIPVKPPSILTPQTQSLILKALKSNILNTKSNDNLLNNPTIPLGDIVVAKYDPIENRKYFTVNTENGDIDLKAWYSKLKVLKAKITFETAEAEVLNFLPMVKNKSKYCPNLVQDIAKNAINKIYGEPIVIKGVYSLEHPYAIVDNIDYSYFYNGSYILLWPTFCDCGCQKAGCQCNWQKSNRNYHQ